MKYKAYINGQPYRMYRGSDGYIMNTYIQGVAFMAIYFDDNLVDTGKTVIIDGVSYTTQFGVTIPIYGERGTSKTLTVVYDGTTKYIDVTFNGGTYEAKFYGGVETLTLTIQGAEAHYIDCTRLRAGTYGCLIKENNNNLGATAGITIPLPDSPNQALIFQTAIEPIGDECFAAVAIFYYRADNTENSLGIHYGYVSDEQATFIITLTRTGD